jgi:hypothetical protein
MSQPARPDPARALGACDSPSPAPLAQPQHRSPARRWITTACLTLAIVLTPATQLAVWTERTFLDGGRSRHFGQNCLIDPAAMVPLLCG